jgi:putative thioredoxin
MSAKILESTGGTFDTDVIEASRGMPVLVDFWADWCQPCKMLTPVLERIAADYAGRARVVKVDTEAERDLATKHGIRSLPTVRVFRHGQAVEEVIGVHPDSALRAMLERYLERPSDRVRAEAARLITEERAPEAVLLLERVLRDEPQHDEIRVELIEALVLAGQIGEADSQFAALPLQAIESPRLKAVEARLHLARALLDAPPAEELASKLAADESDLKSAHQLAAREFTTGQVESALDRWLAILRKDRTFDDGLARRSLLAAFTLLEGQDELVHRYRRQMMALLH